MSAVPSNGHGQAPQIGAAPPHSIEAEQSVLGAVLLWDGALYGLVIEEGLKPEDFYRDRHRLIYESMLALYQESQPVDPLTVTEHLRSRGELENAGGPAIHGKVPKKRNHGSGSAPWYPAPGRGPRRASPGGRGGVRHCTGRRSETSPAARHRRNRERPPAGLPPAHAARPRGRRHRQPPAAD